MSGFIPVDACDGGGATSGMPVAPSGGLYQAEGGAWVPTNQTLGTLYMWSADTTATDPGTGEVKGNNASENLITEVYMSKTASNGADLTGALIGLGVGSFFYSYSSEDSTSYATAVVTGAIVDNGTWLTIPVIINSFGGTFADGEPINISVIPFSTLSIERLLDGVSLATSQQPTGEGEANSVSVEFGAAQGTISDPVMIDANGLITFNVTGLYRLKLTVVYGRQGAAGVSELRFRALVNGVQAGQTVGVEIDNANTEIPFSDEAWLNIPAGVTIQYELMRDSSGNNSGGLFQPAVTGATAPSWNACSCAVIRIERWSS